VKLFFEEGLHAIEAAISEQCVTICTDVLGGSEHVSGKLLWLSDVTLAGLGFHVFRRCFPPIEKSTTAVSYWVQLFVQSLTRNGAFDFMALRVVLK
jgi:hypothetical protein